MAQPGLMTGGVYFRYWRVKLPLSGATPKSLAQLMSESADFGPNPSGPNQPNSDEQILRSPSEWIVGAALREISNPMYVFGPMPKPPPIVTSTYADYAPYIPGGSNANGHSWTPATQGDWTEACTEMLQTAFFCGQSASVVVTAKMILYLKKFPLA